MYVCMLHFTFKIYHEAVTPTFIGIQVMRKTVVLL